MSSSGNGRRPLLVAAEELERIAAQPHFAADIDVEALQRLLAGAIRNFVRLVEEGTSPRPLPSDPALQPTTTDVLVAVTELLAACEVEVFELGMWQTWGSARTIDEPAPPAGKATHE